MEPKDTQRTGNQSPPLSEQAQLFLETESLEQWFSPENEGLTPEFWEKFIPIKDLCKFIPIDRKGLEAYGFSEGSSLSYSYAMSPNMPSDNSKVIEIMLSLSNRLVALAKSKAEEWLNVTATPTTDLGKLIAAKTLQNGQEQRAMKAPNPDFILFEAAYLIRAAEQLTAILADNLPERDQDENLDGQNTTKAKNIPSQTLTISEDTITSLSALYTKFPVNKSKIAVLLELLIGGGGNSEAIGQAIQEIQADINSLEIAQETLNSLVPNNSDSLNAAIVIHTLKQSPAEAYMMRQEGLENPYAIQDGLDRDREIKKAKVVQKISSRLLNCKYSLSAFRTQYRESMEKAKTELQSLLDSAQPSES